MKPEVEVKEVRLRAVSRETITVRPKTMKRSLNVRNEFECQA